jgi:ferritin-like metal-binding protein YciE
MTKKARELLEHGLKDMYDAEQRFTKALGTMIENSHDRSLVDGFRRHRDVTKNQVKRLEQAFEEIGSRPAREECLAATGLVREYEKFVDEEGAADGMHDTFAATAGLKVEHYEIASYRALVDLAEFCDFAGAAKLLKQNLAEEEQAAGEMQSAATKLSAELAGASTAEMAQRSVGAMVSHVREGTFAAVGGVMSVGERAVDRARSVVRTAEKRGRKRLGEPGSAVRSAKTTAKRKAATVKRKASASKSSAKRRATTAKRKATRTATTRTRGTSKGTRTTRSVSRPRAKSSTGRSRSTTARRTASRPAGRKSTARRSTARRTSR